MSKRYREYIRKEHQKHLRRIGKRRSSRRQRATPARQPMAFADPQEKNCRRSVRLDIETRRRGYNEKDSYDRAFIRSLLISGPSWRYWLGRV